MTWIRSDIARVFAGGFIGSALRIWLGVSLFAYLAQTHNELAISMLASLSVNVIGAFLLGALWALFQAQRIRASQWQFFGIGILGAFTSFSALTLDALVSIKLQLYGVFAMYIIGTLVTCVIAAWIGFYCVARCLPAPTDSASKSASSE